MIDTKKDPLPDYEKHSGEANKLEKYFKDKLIQDISLDDVLPTSDEYKSAINYVYTLSREHRRSKMNCLTTFAKANPCNGRVLCSRGSSRLAYLIKYFVYQRRKSETETETKRVMYQRRSA